MLRKILYKPFFIKLLHWEYWPFSLVYGPVMLYWVWFCVKARSLFFFNAANPSIENGGFLLESKKKIYDIISPEYYPSTVFIKSNIDSEKLLHIIKDSGLEFPLIGKPDVGGKGRLVKKLNSINEVIDYNATMNEDFLLQKFVEYKNEAGIFYYRYPGEQKGHISGIVEKEFLNVTGDGFSSIEQLLLKEKRYILQLSSLKKIYKDELKKVLKKDESYLLVPYGNHARGAKFIDISFLIDDTLTYIIDALCRQIPGFYFGRLDIRFNTWEELKQGKNFSIIELNGAGSEPTHIYDPKHSIFFAWKEIIRHWNILYRISKLNHRHKKISYMKFSSGIYMLYESNKYMKLKSKESPKCA